MSKSAKLFFIKLQQEDGKELDSRIRYRMRMCIWKHWEIPQMRARNLIKLGVSKRYAWSTAYLGAKIAYIC